MKFAYRSYPTAPSPADPSDTILKPALKVQVIGHRDDLPLWGIIDTGAEDCLLPFEIGAAVGAKWANSTQFISGAGGEKHRVRYGLVIFRIAIEKQILKWPATVAFSTQRSEALWGLTGFLEHFRVTLDGPGQCFTIRRRGEASRNISIEPLPRPRARRPRGASPPILPDDQAP